MGTYLQLNAVEIEKLKREVEFIMPVKKQVQYSEYMNEFAREGYAKGIEQGVAQGVAQGVVQGIEQGIELGVAQGLHDGHVRFAFRLLYSMFGKLELSAEKKVKGLSIEQLEELGEAMLHLKNKAQLLSWLDDQLLNR